MNTTLSHQINFGAGGGTLQVDKGANFNTGQQVVYNLANGWTGAGTLTKTGLGILQLIATENFGGNIVIAANGGQVNLRASAPTTFNIGAGRTGSTTGNDGQLSNANPATITVNQFGILSIDNLNTLGFNPTTAFGNRLSDAYSINLRGGSFIYTAANTAGVIREVIGTTTLAQEVSTIDARSGGSTGNGGEIEITNLVHSVGVGSAVNFTVAAANTFGQAGQFGRIFLDSVNGTATTAATGFVGGWALGNWNDFVYNYGASGSGVASYANTLGNGGGATVGYTAGGNSTTLTTVAFGNNPNGVMLVSSTNTTLAANTFLLNPGSGTNNLVNAIKFTGTTATVVTFQGASDVLNVVSGGILVDSTSAKTLGVAGVTAGHITVGGTASTAVVNDLYLHARGEQHHRQLRDRRQRHLQNIPRHQLRPQRHLQHHHAQQRNQHLLRRHVHQHRSRQRHRRQLPRLRRGRRR
jgi:hypothetical protein